MSATETKAAPKKSTKKAAAKKSAAKKNSSPKKDQGKDTKSKERRQAKLIEVSLPQFRVLSALAKSSGGLSYSQIKDKTGYYNLLTAMMRTEYEDSLCDKGFAKEEQHDVDNRDTLIFSITPKGKQALEKARKSK